MAQRQNSANKAHASGSWLKSRSMTNMSLDWQESKKYDGTKLELRWTWVAPTGPWIDIGFLFPFSGFLLQLKFNLECLLTFSWAFLWASSDIWHSPVPQNDAQCGSVDRVVSLPACHRFWPEALAEALKVNKTLTNINLRDNGIGKEGPEAWCLARGAPLGPR